MNKTDRPVLHDADGKEIGRDPVDNGAFSPVENEAPLRWWRLLRLAPTDGLGAGRRAVLFALLAWLPIVLWALATGRTSAADKNESLFAHYGLHVRCLLVIPLLILAEASLHRSGKEIARQFGTSGLVPPALHPSFETAIRSVARLRDTTLPWAFAIGAAIAWSIGDSPDAHGDEMSWSLEPAGAIGFGGWWFAYVARPILVALLVGWLWRLVIVTYWMWRVARLPLAMVPSHPDRAGGLGFIGKLPAAFAMVTFALSATLSSRWAHLVIYHDATLVSFQPTAIAYAVAWTLVLLLPLFATVPLLRSTRKKALPMYAALVAAQGRLVHRRWIERQDLDDDTMLEPEGVGPVADAAAMYEAVEKMHPIPFGPRVLVLILVPMAIPFVLLALLRIPLKEVLASLLKVLT